MFRLIETGASSDVLGVARGGVVALLLHAGIVTGAELSTHGAAQPVRDMWVDTVPIVFPARPQVTGPDPLSVPHEDVCCPVFFPSIPTVSIPVTVDGARDPRTTWLPAGPGPTSHPAVGTVYAPASVDDYPELLAAAPPQYPELLRRAGIEGRVVVEATVDTLGRVERGTVVVVLTPHPGFAAPAVAYLEHALFRPARVQGRAVRVRIRQGIEFRIRR